MRWATGDGVGTSSKSDLETIGLSILITEQKTNSSLCQNTPRDRVILQEIWRSLHSCQILHASGSISVHRGLYSVMGPEPEPSGLELEALPTGCA